MTRKKNLFLCFLLYHGMASVGIEPSAAVRDPTGNATDVDRLPEEMNHMKIQDDKVWFLIVFFVASSLIMFFFLITDLINDHQEMEATIVNGNVTETGHIIVTTIGGRNGQPKQVCVLDP